MMSQTNEVLGIRNDTYVYMDVDLVEAMTKLETLRALRDAIRQERQILHRVMASITTSGVDASRH
jgi:hypothetical protein